MSKKSSLEKIVYDILDEEDEIRRDLCTDPFKDPLHDYFQEYQEGAYEDDWDDWDDEPYYDWDDWYDDWIDDSDEDDWDD